MCTLGLSSLAFESFSTTEEEFEQHFARAETIIRRNGATLRKLKCGANGALYAKMLPPTAVLDSLDVHLDDDYSPVGYTFDKLHHLALDKCECWPLDSSTC